MRTAIVTIEGCAPYSPNKYVEDRKDKEPYEVYEERIWRERGHYDKDGNMFIPPMALYHSLCASAKFRGDKYKGNFKFTGRFEKGVLCFEPLFIGITKDKLNSETIPVPSDGTPGGRKRVFKTFPIVHEWGGDAIYQIADDEITKKIFEKTVVDAGKFIGLGRFRPDRKGFYGRFLVKDIKWSNGS